MHVYCWLTNNFRTKFLDTMLSLKLIAIFWAATGLYAVVLNAHRHRQRVFRGSLVALPPRALKRSAFAGCRFHPCCKKQLKYPKSSHLPKIGNAQQFQYYLPPVALW